MKRRGILVMVVVFGTVVVGCSTSNSGAPSAVGTTSTAPPATLIAPGSAGTTPPHDVAIDVAPTPAAPDAQKTAADTVASLRSQLPYTDEQIACVEDRLSRNQPLLDEVHKGVAQGSTGFGGVVRLAQVCVQAVTFGPQFAQNAQRQAGGTLTAAQMKCLTDKYVGLPSDVLEKVNQASVDMTAPGRSDLAKQMDDMIASCGVTLSK